MEDIFSLKLKLDLDYIERKKEYDAHVSELKTLRDKFYSDNPDFPIKTMYMNVIAPPTKISINII